MTDQIPTTTQSSSRLTTLNEVFVQVVPVGPELFSKYRARRKVSQGALAKRAGVSPSTIAKIEAGDRRPSEEILELCVRAMLCSVSEHNLLLISFGYLPIGDPLVQIEAMLTAYTHLPPMEYAGVIDRLRIDIEERYACYKK